MKPWMKVALGLASHWFFFYFPVFFVAIFATIITGSRHGGGQPPAWMVLGIIALVCVHFLSILIVMGTMGLFIAYAAKQPAFSSNERLLWILLLAFMGVMASPVFYWMYVFRHPIGAPFFSGARSMVPSTSSES